MATKPPPPTIDNRRARHDYLLGEKLIAGIVLSGAEVSNIRRQRVSIKNAFVSIDRGEVRLRNLATFAQGGKESDAQTSHRLLLTKAQIKKLAADVSGRGQTIIVLKLLLGKRIKAEIAPATGKKRPDKREAIKRRESETAIKRRLKQAGKET